MTFYSENEIRAIHAEFRGLKKYPDKLYMFDRLFGIIPFSFPDFDPQLSFLFQKEKMDGLIDNFRKERNNPGLTEKKFSFEESFIFNIKPANSNNAAFSNYILKNFLSRQPVFDKWIEINNSGEKSIESLLGEANDLMNHLEYCLQNEYDKSFRLQCISVFYKGFHDAYTRRVNLPEKKRKFTELYLYAQGIIYSNYIRSLKVAFKKFRNPMESQTASQLNLPAKLILLENLGVIDLLKDADSKRNPFLSNYDLTELICLITGECIEQKDMVHSFLVNGQKANGIDRCHSRKK